MLGTKSSQKNAKKTFFIFTRISCPKNGGKNARNNFSRNTLIDRAKNVGKKIDAKKCEKTFFIFIRLSLPKNGGEKSSKQIFQKHTNDANKKCCEKNRS